MNKSSSPRRSDFRSDDRPFNRPQDVKGSISDQHPQTDTNVDPHEVYDEGLSSASGVSNPEEKEKIGKLIDNEGNER